MPPNPGEKQPAKRFPVRTLPDGTSITSTRKPKPTDRVVGARAKRPAPRSQVIQDHYDMEDAKEKRKKQEAAQNKEGLPPKSDTSFWTQEKVARELNTTVSRALNLGSPAAFGFVAHKPANVAMTYKANKTTIKGTREILDPKHQPPKVIGKKTGKLYPKANTDNPDMFSTDEPPKTEEERRAYEHKIANRDKMEIPPNIKPNFTTGSPTMGMTETELAMSDPYAGAANPPEPEDRNEPMKLPKGFRRGKKRA